MIPDCRRAIVAGSLGLDIIPVFSSKSNSKVNLFAQGKYNDMEGTRLYLGGCVGNTGIAMHKLGVPTTLLSKVGDDLIGEVIRTIIADQNVHIRLDTVTSERSTSTVILSPPGGDRILLHSRGASQTFVSADIKEELLNANDHVHFGYPTAMKYLYADNGREFIRLVEKCKRSGLTVSIDTSQPDPNSDAGSANWRGILTETLPLIDVFMPSLEEIIFMLHRDLFDEINMKRGTGNFLDYIDRSVIIEISDELIAMGAKIVLLKLGKHGLYLKTCGRERMTELGKARPEDITPWVGRSLLCPAYSTDRILSTTGAGDNAVAAFLASFLMGDCPEMAMLLANANAKRCIESCQTTDNVVPIGELRKEVSSLPKQEKSALIDLSGAEMSGNYSVFCV